MGEETRVPGGRTTSAQKGPCALNPEPSYYEATEITTTTNTNSENLNQLNEVNITAPASHQFTEQINALPV